MRKILIFGHKNPDTDSVCSAISMSNLKNKLGLKTEPRVLGDINEETKFVLNHLNIQAPKYLNDVKLQIKDISYRKRYYINNKESIFKAFYYMNKKDISTIPVIDENKKYSKSLAMKDIARNQIMGNSNYLSTSYDHILETLNGDKVLKFDDEIKGEITAASFRSTTFMDIIELNNNDILIVGDRHSIIEYAIENNVKLLIITNNGEVKKKHLKLAERNKVNIIKTPLDSFNTSIKIGLSNYIKDISYTKDLLCINENDYVSDIQDLTRKTRYGYYPIVDKNKNCLGLLKVADLNDKKPKQVILVDHNEYSQSADGIEEAQIIEIVDHHKIGTTGTFYPINFRNMPVGSTCTIIYNLYKENNVEIDKKMATIMISGIISDTLILNSPTTTDVDKIATEELARIAELDYKKYGMEMLKAGSNIKGKTIREIIYKDFKVFDNDGIKIGVGQVLTTDISELLDKKEEIINELNIISKDENYDILTLFLTDILNNGSYILYSDNSYNKIKYCFKQSLEESSYLDGYISRKKQILPAIIGGIGK